jgi:hypothetical protein
MIKRIGNDSKQINLKKNDNLGKKNFFQKKKNEATQFLTN